MTQVAIIGAGIGGLTLYHALRRRGIRATIYEAAPELQEVGAGIAVPANGMQVLARLGLADEVLRRGWAIERAEIRDARAGVLRTLDLTPQVQEFGYGIVGIHRAALHEVLARGTAPEDLHLGKACVHVRAGGPSAEVSFADGSTVRAPIVVGADGIRSVVRQSIFPTSRLRPWLHTGYRAVVSFNLPPDFRRVSQLLWVDGCEFGFTNIGGDQVYWFVSVPVVTAAHEDGEGAVGALRRRVSGLAGPIRDLVMATEWDALIRTDLYDLAPLRTWYLGNVVLMGDAAHATTPYLGQGAAQAMEDAYVLAAKLADALRTGSPAIDAFTAFQRVRMAKANSIVRLSRLLGHFAYVRNPVLRTARNALYRLTPAAVARRQLDQLCQLNF